MFENPEISLDQLPSMDELQWRPLDKRLARLMLIRAGISLAFVCLLVAAIQIVATLPPQKTASSFSLPGSGSARSCSQFPRCPGRVVAVPRKGYVVRAKDIVFRTGVLWRTVTAIPYNRIQHVEKDSAPLDRRFDIANLKIFTAGGSGGDLKIDGLPADDAERLRIHILDKVGAAVEQH